jgi:hypothetical protein
MGKRKGGNGSKSRRKRRHEGKILVERVKYVQKEQVRQKVA